MEAIAAFLPKDSQHHVNAGCAKCHYGIVSAPELTRAVELYRERVVQFLAGDLTFCGCKAGKLYEVGLLNLRQQMLEKNPSELYEAQRRIMHSYEMLRVPTVHYEPAAQQEQATP